MPIKHADFVIQGMFRDVSEHAFDSKFAYENQNLRITAEPNSSGKHTSDMYALTNEKGNKYVSINGLDSNGRNMSGSFGDMKGCPIGQCLINNQWVVFTTELPEEIFIDGEEKEIEDFPIEETTINDITVKTYDRIYRLWFNGDVLTGELLYEGHLNFDCTMPIETIGNYENSDIQKVYWTDGLNQPRFINIVEKEDIKNKWNDTSFDFVATLKLEEKVFIERVSGNGQFPAGVIQYFFTYSNNFGVETNVFYASQLYPIIQNETRGLSPEEKAALSFKITLNNLDTNFQFLNIYSVIRTSLDNFPICKRVGHVTFNSSYDFYDINEGEVVEPQSLFYKGGNEISVYTFDQKDNTLFLGNYTLKQSYIPEEIRTSLREYCTKLSRSNPLFERSFIDLNNGRIKSCQYTDHILYDGIGEEIHNSDIDNALSWSQDKEHYDHGIFAFNYYRLGLQFQYFTGKWSEVVWIGDYKATEFIDEDSFYAPFNAFRLDVDNTIKSTIQNLIDLGYRKIRPVVCYPNQSNKTFICQGVLQSSIFIANENSMNKFYPDFFIRDENAYKTEYIGKENVDGISKIYESYGGGLCLYPIENTSISYRTSTFGYRTFSGRRKMSINSNDKNVELCFSNNVMSLFTYDVLDINNPINTMNFSNCYLRYNDYISTQRDEVKKDVTITGTTKNSNGFVNPYWTDSDGIRHEYSRNEDITNPLIVNSSNLKRIYRATSDYGKGFINSFETTTNRYGHLVSGYAWSDYFANPLKINDEELGVERPTDQSTLIDDQFRVLYPIDVWQHSGSINYDRLQKTSVLKSNKTLNTFRVSFPQRRQVVYNDTKIATPSYMEVWNGGIIGNSYNNGIMLYDGNVDAIINCKITNPPTYTRSKDAEGSAAWNKVFYNNIWLNITWHNWWRDEKDELPDPTTRIYSYDTLYDSFSFSADVKYRTPPHIVVFGNKAQAYEQDERGHYYITQEAIDSSLDSEYCSKSCDLLQNVDSSIYQGRNGVNIHDSYCVAGQAVDIYTKEYNQTEDKYDYKAKTFTVYYTNGDLYRMNTSFLRTFALTQEDENNYIEGWKMDSLSYINPLCRYDRNSKNFHFGSNLSNFWLINSIYNQKNNFMSYHELDLKTQSVNDFPNSFTWTLTKWAGDEVDKWTQITLASTMDVDGSNGRITKIIKFQDQLLCFQPNQVSQILYNEREQIATGSGVPVELSNSGKVSGVRPITVLAGCNNKWSIAKSEKGLYWIDDVNKQILGWQGQLGNLSDGMGFHSWINDKASLNVWNPLDFKSFVSYYDPYNENVMFIYKNNVLSFSEQLNCFDTFLPYNSVPYYMAFNDSAFMLSNRDGINNTSDYKVWEMFKGDYNYFFVHDKCVYENNTLKLKGRYDMNDKPTDYGYNPYWTTLLVNPDMPYDKVFNNLDMRTDMWDKNKQLLEETFSHIETWNEFQWNKSVLLRQLDLPKIHYPDQHSILKKKFRVWYTNIPRDIKKSNPRLRYYNRDRMRNTWLYIKLSKELIDNDVLIKYPYISDNKHIIHHIGVSYFV